eukprot:scaffold165_cov106-Skeletonema_dohrnii-CCMP3373.AAC.2
MHLMRHITSKVEAKLFLGNLSSYNTAKTKRSLLDNIMRQGYTYKVVTLPQSKKFFLLKM